MSNEKFFAAMPFSINESNVRPFIIFVNKELTDVITQYRELLSKNDYLSNLTIGHSVIDASVILLSGSDTDFSMDFKEEIKGVVDSVEAPNPNDEIVGIMDVELFEEWMFAPELNLSENTQLILTEGGFYFTCQWETDLTESSMFDYSDFGL